jgi:endonuclease/exonuclease/phosphatase family metal-dependent hydrolase
MNDPPPRFQVLCPVVIERIQRLCCHGLLLIVLLPGMSYAADSTAAAPLRVMTYNIRYDNPADTGAVDWKNRRDKVASMIRFHGAHVVGTQEGKLHQLMDLEDRLPGYEWIGVGRRASGDEFSALFYDTRRLTLLEHDTFWLSASPNEPGSKSWGAALPRIATWARFRDRRSGDSLFVLNTHFDHESKEARAKSARLIAETVGGLAKSDPIVVMGDFNAPPSAPPYQILTRTGEEAPPDSLRDAREASEHPHHGPVSTYNHFESTVRPDRRLDYIFVGPRLIVRRHGHLTDRWNGQYPSDHLPVLAEVTIRPSTQE